VPGSDALRISADQSLKDVRIQIYDQSGKLVHQEKARQWAAGAHRLNWQPGQQSSGAFYVRLRSREHRMEWQLVVPGIP
jgi:flagellar hook assembly protein FlgD